MPPARSAAPPRRPSTLGAAALRVRWDRVGRVALLGLLVLVVGLYIGPARSYLSTQRESNERHAQLDRLQREHDQLLREENHLRDPRTLQAEARRLGMVRPGEIPYTVQGLPRN